MPSKARRAFDLSSQDVKRLPESHDKLGGERQGRRYQLAVLNKSAIVLIAAIWEAYCEDIAAEGIAHLVAHSNNASRLSKSVRKVIAKELKSDLDELAIWQLADNGWKAELQSRLVKMKESRAKKLNTPRAENIKLLFQDALGIDDISKAEVSTGWRWQRPASVGPLPTGGASGFRFKPPQHLHHARNRAA